MTYEKSFGRQTRRHRRQCRGTNTIPNNEGSPQVTTSSGVISRHNSAQENNDTDVIVLFFRITFGEHEELGLKFRRHTTMLLQTVAEKVAQEIGVDCKILRFLRDGDDLTGALDMSICDLDFHDDDAIDVVLEQTGC